MYLRFVVNEFNEESNQRLGIFHAIRYLKDDGEFLPYELAQAESVMNWFSNHLESPLDYLNKQKSKKSDVFISWFKVSARLHIQKVREFAIILEGKGVIVEQLKTDNPVEIVYEDDHQVFARPYERY
ncbi:hypothetical protein RS130_11465 [Paraglaciecola aquimarina]|uniref:Uncharacterized protein n=1 Tax=Paraglaciecola aquimarina TaxID=1235557 RepID=A0ABU3SWT5_9ALTE|nr:hypothetical protein [Paraglaciecola aquimarina]MDU0354469.1 hypothetical protein [Paraglaciecola aquimarina]